jgi:hypothetical protein
MFHPSSKSKSRKSRSFRPSSDGLEPRLQLTAHAAGALASFAHVSLIAKPAGPEADIALENLNVQSLGNNQFRVTATLENVGFPTSQHASASRTASAVQAPPLGPAYPGGGLLQISSTTGGTILNSQPTGSALSTPLTPQTIASMPIPALNYHQSVQLSTVVTGKAVFAASAVAARSPIGLPLPFPDGDTSDNTKTVDNLVQHTYTVNTTTMGLIPTLVNATHNTLLTLDANNSHLFIPGVIDTHFTIPGQTVSVGLGPLSVSATYYVNNLVATNASLSYEQGGLAITVNFANNSHALHTSSSLLPDIGVTNLQVKVFLPLTYNAQYQYFKVGTSRAQVTGNWSANGPVGSLFDLLLPNINQKVSSAVTGLINSKLDVLSYQVTKPIHDFLGAGRIVSASVQQNQLILAVETQN